MREGPYRSYQLFLFFSLFLCFPGPGLLAQNLREAQFVSQSREGFQALYNLDHAGAKQIFLALESRYPTHPAPPLYVATAICLHELFVRQELDLNRFISPGYFTETIQKVMDPEDRRVFHEGIRESQQLTQDILASNPGHQDARYFMGLSYGILGSFAMTVDHKRDQALRYGKKAYQYHRDLVDEDADYYDAYMSVGVYEYIVANLPWYIRWLAAIIGYRGNEERAFEYLNLAAEKGRYVSDDARVMLMVLLVRENRYREALAQASFLHAAYPGNYLLHLNRTQILERMGQTRQAIEEYQAITELAESRKPNYQKLPLTNFRFALGLKYLELNHHDLALQEFRRSIGDPEIPQREKALSHLLAGQISDLQGRRDEAILYYRQVLAYPDVEDSHSRARDFIEDPYQD